MNNKDFWESVNAIIAEGFTPEGLQKIDEYAEQFITGRLVYQRFSPAEQHGCTAGGPAHVVASLLAGANVATNCSISEPLSFKEECERGKAQEIIIENWSKKINCWFDKVDVNIPKVLGEQIAQGGEARVFQHCYNLWIRLLYPTYSCARPHKPSQCSFPRNRIACTRFRTTRRWGVPSNRGTAVY